MEELLITSIFTLFNFIVNGKMNLKFLNLKDVGKMAPYNLAAQHCVKTN